jgi:hypothetical protein
MSLLFIDRVKTNQAAFAAKVIDISKALQINPEWLMILMYIESGINEKAVNGLIGFMPSTAKMLGTTVDALRAMTNVKQLDYVYKLYKGKAGQFTCGEDLALFNFFPLAVGKPDSFVLQAKNLSAETIARYNPYFDLNKDHQITVGEWRQWHREHTKKKIPEAAWQSWQKKNRVIGILGAVLIGGVLAYLFR